MSFMMKNTMMGGVAVAVLAMALPAVAQVQRIRANVRGGDGDGKCTFEVNVDGVAEVEIHGDTGILRTLEGNMATWRRLDCSAHFPNNPGDFRFKGVDGRGRQTLVRDPRGSGGVAVIRLEDPKGGSEGYTGDITWRGGDSHWGGGGNWNTGGSGWDYNNGSNNNSNYNSWQGSRGINYKDAVAICRNQVSRVRSVNPNDVSVRRSSNQDFEMDFSFRNYNNTVSGSCNVSTTGQLLNFRINGGGYNDHITMNQALTVCEKEVERRLSVGPNDVRVQHGVDPGNGSFTINYQGRRNNGTIATGVCTVSPNGQISNFQKW